jgi:hypothetical protein
MINRSNPQQILLFDRVEEILHPKAKARLDENWPGVFRQAILQLMPVKELGEGFSPNFGRPSKEHYSICGLLLLKEYFGWTDEETIDQYLYSFKIQYALKIQPDNLKLSVRTLARYQKIFREKELAQKLMQDVTSMIIRELNIQIDKQRLDSTHVFSNMADWSRSMLLFRTIKRFLVQVKRHESRLYSELDENLRKEYESKGDWIYTGSKTRNVRYGTHECDNREQLGWDMLRLIERFENHPKLSRMNSFNDMVRIFSEQCQIDNGKVKIRKNPGGRAMVNPSDPDATIDNKGTGYQSQVCETCSAENPVQIVTGALPQTASECDQNSPGPMLEELEKINAKPEKLLADSAYGSDENLRNMAGKGIELISPTTGKDSKKVGLEECELDDENRIIRCPCGRHPLQKRYANGKGRAVFAGSVCGNCPMLERCSASRQGGNYVIAYDAKSLRLRERRLYEKTDEFREKYRLRSGIEGLFGRLKQITPLRRLRIRGRLAVFNSIYAIMTVHNIMQMTRFYKMKPFAPRNTLFPFNFSRLRRVLDCSLPLKAA